MAVTPTIDEAKLEAFMERFVGELGACATAPLVLIGDKLGLYKAMADSEPVTPAQLAERTSTNERYIREWLCQQAASDYLEYDASEGTFRLPPDQALPEVWISDDADHYVLQMNSHLKFGTISLHLRSRSVKPSPE
jgi:hypothetical protein